jgi:AraC-like DNA-binding protein
LKVRLRDAKLPSPKPVRNMPPADLDTQVIRSCTSMPWHQHDAGYAAIVLAGHYVEAGDGGRRRVSAGDVIVHRPFSAHADWFEAAGATVVNIALTQGAALRLATGRVADPEALARDILADRDAAERLLGAAIVRVDGEDDAPDRLAAGLDHDPGLTLGDWAARTGTAPRTLRRQFGQAYGISPLLYRTRSRALQAWKLIVTTDRPFAGIAYDLGFADQAHMSRAVRWLSGRPPRAWRGGDGPSIQDGDPATAR